MTREEIMQLTADQLEARMDEIRSASETEGADYAALNTEAGWIEERREALRSQENARRELRQRVAKGMTGTIVRKLGQTEQRTFAPDTVEYRDAYMKNLMGKELTQEERTALTQAGAVIPTTTVNRVYDKMRENPLFAEIDATHIAGYVSVPKVTTVNAANWVAMGTAATDGADVVDPVSLGLNKLIKTIEITADIEATSIPAFETWLVGKLAEQMIAAICAAVMTGTGSGAPLGVMAANAGATAVTKAFTIAGLSSAMGSLPSAYHKNAVWVMAASTFFTTIVPLSSDVNGALVMNGIEYRFLGHKVVLDDNAAAKIVYGDFKDGYAFNFGKEISIDRDNSVGFRTGSTVYRAMALCDGKPVQGEAFVVVTASA